MCVAVCVCVCAVQPVTFEKEILCTFLFIKISHAMNGFSGDVDNGPRNWFKRW